MDQCYACERDDGHDDGCPVRILGELVDETKPYGVSPVRSMENSFAALDLAIAEGFKPGEWLMLDSIVSDHPRRPTPMLYRDHDGFLVITGASGLFGEKSQMGWNMVVQQAAEEGREIVLVDTYDPETQSASFFDMEGSKDTMDRRLDQLDRLFAGPRDRMDVKIERMTKQMGDHRLLARDIVLRADVDEDPRHSYLRFNETPSRFRPKRGKRNGRR